MNDLDFTNYINTLVLENKDEVFSFTYDNKKYWLKRARATKSPLLHKIYFKIFPFEILLPVETKTPKEALDFETSKIEKFQSFGIKTPHIVVKTDEYFVLEDCGKMVNSYIRKRDISKDEMYYFVDKLVDTLVLIHNNNQFHGGAQARNFIYNNREICVIDFEDSFDKSIDIKLLQFRDLILLLLSFTKTRAGFEFDYKYVIESYIEKSSNFEFREKLISMGNKLSWLINLSEIKIIKKILGRDVKGFFKFLKSLKSL